MAHCRGGGAVLEHGGARLWPVAELDQAPGGMLAGRGCQLMPRGVLEFACGCAHKRFSDAKDLHAGGDDRLANADPRQARQQDAVD